MIDPRKVAEAIVYAAEKPQRAVKVGAMSKMNTFIAKAAPGLGEFLASKQASSFKSQEPPRNPDGTLYCPGDQAEFMAKAQWPESLFFALPHD
jgi:hypothetical protein